MTEFALTPETLADALRAAEARVTRTDDDGVTARVFDGLRGREATLKVAEVEARVLAADGDPRAALGSFARGVAAALTEPARGAGPPDSFAGAARTLLPTLEGPLYAAGLEAAGAKSPWLQPWASDLVVAYLVELDEGFHVLSGAEVDEWHVTPDRVHKASLSILFHRTSFGCFDEVCDGVEAFSMNDGHDAARALIFDMWDYTRARAGVAFCLPTPGDMLLTDDLSDAGIARLTEQARERYESSATPLSLEVFRFVDGRLAAQ